MEVVPVVVVVVVVVEKGAWPFCSWPCEQRPFDLHLSTKNEGPLLPVQNLYEHFDKCICCW